MSTIKVDNIRIASESVSRPATGVAAAWGGVTAAGSRTEPNFNISSVQNDGAGLVSFMFATDFTNTTYSITTGINSSTDETVAFGGNTVSSVQLRSFNASGTLSNKFVCLSIHGELA